MRRLLLTLVMVLTSMTIIYAKSNEAEAHDILIKSLSLLQNPGGAQMSYDLKASFIHKSGWILMKGKKFKRSSRKTTDWYDGKTFWSRNKKTGIVTIKNPKHKTDDDAAVTSQLNLVRDGCRYAVTTQGNYYKIYVNAEKKDVKFKKAEFLINRDTYAPVQVRLKFGPIWATINLKSFKTGNYANSNFVFDKSDFPGCQIIDKR